MDSKCESSCHCHNGDGDGSSVHIDGSAKRNGYGVGITVKSHFLAGFHIYRNVGCGASGEEGCDGTFLQAVQDQRIRILTDAPVNQNGIGYKVNEKHAANQKGKKFSVGSENIQSVGGYGVKYQAEDSKWCQVDDPADYQRSAVCNICKCFLGGVASAAEGKSKKNSPGKDSYIVCVYQRRDGVGNQC